MMHELPRLYCIKAKPTNQLNKIDRSPALSQQFILWAWEYSGF